MKKLHCPYCKQEPHEISKYVEQAEMYGITPEEFVRTEEGTYSQPHNVFTCTSCYIKIGMPLNSDLFYAYTQYREAVRQ